MGNSTLENNKGGIDVFVDPDFNRIRFDLGEWMALRYEDVAVV